MRLADCLNISDLRHLARKKLPLPVFDYLERGSDDEYSVINNSKAYDKYELIPQILNDVERISLKTRVFGIDIDWPVILAPTGMSRMFHPEGELAVSRAAARSGTLYSLSTFSNFSIEEVAAAGGGPRLFQLYALKDKGLTNEIIARCKENGFRVLCLTVDATVAGNREHIIRSGLGVPPKLTPGSILQFSVKPGWLYDFLRSPPWQLGNLGARKVLSFEGKENLSQFLGGLVETRLNWRIAEQLAVQWGGEFAIKGVMSPDDARRAVDAGATGLFVSNHGGRQLDGSAAPIDLISRVRERVGDAPTIIADGGVNRGTHVLKALALGASACSIGRPYLYGLACGGEQGVARALNLLRSELERDLALAGCSDPGDVSSTLVRAA